MKWKRQQQKQTSKRRRQRKHGTSLRTIVEVIANRAKKIKSRNLDLHQ